MQRVEKQVRAVGAAIWKILEDVLFQLFSSFSFEIVCNSNFDKEKCNHLVIRRELSGAILIHTPHFFSKVEPRSNSYLSFPRLIRLTNWNLGISGDCGSIGSVSEVEVPTIQLQERLVDVPCVELREEPTEVSRHWIAT